MHSVNLEGHQATFRGKTTDLIIFHVFLLYCITEGIEEGNVKVIRGKGKSSSI